MITVATSYVATRNRLNGCVTVIDRSVSTYKQARSQEVRRDRLILLKAFIRGGGGGGGREEELGKSVRSPSRLAGQIRKARHLRA